MVRSIQVVVIYFSLEILVRILIPKNKSREFRYVIVLTSFLLILYTLKLLSLFEVLTPVFYIVFTLSVASLLMTKDRIFFTGCIFAPVIEEIICRKFILEEFITERFVLAIVISTVFFLVFHCTKSLAKILFIIGASLFISFIQTKTGNVGDAIAIHGLINLCLVIGAKFNTD